MTAYRYWRACFNLLADKRSVSSISPPSQTLPQEALRRGSLNSNLGYHLTPYPTIQETSDYSPCTVVMRDDLIRKPDTTQMQTPCASLSLCRSLPSVSLNASSTELQRVLDSLLNQVDWLEMASEVAKD